MTGTQREHFLTTEGDRWFTRNLAALERCDPATDIPLRLLALYGVRPRRAVEIGASNGYRIAAVAEHFGAQATAVEGSAAAVADGRARFPAVEFIHSDGAAIPLSTPFDLVIVAWVFQWIDRAYLLRTVAEVDRLVADDGYLIVGDFLPANKLRVPYHHLPGGGLHTYKQDYAAIFLASGLYHPVGMLGGDHGDGKLSRTAGEAQRSATWLLRKQLFAHYVDTALDAEHPA